MASEPTDHARGCQGREYTCTCGYDDRLAPLLSSQEAEIERLRSLVTATVAAWEALPGDRHYSPRVVESWMIHHMAPAINELRAALTPLPEGGQ